MIDKTCRSLAAAGVRFRWLVVGLWLVAGVLALRALPGAVRGGDPYEVRS